MQTQTTKAPAAGEPGVVITVAKACLIGRRYCMAGESITVSEAMADKVCRTKFAAYGKLSLAAAMEETGTKGKPKKAPPAPAPEKVPAPDAAPENAQDVPEDAPDDSADLDVDDAPEADQVVDEAPEEVEDVAEVEEPAIPSALEDIGLAGRVADLLRSADPPIDTVGQLRDLIADGFDPETINGIGPASAESIRAAIANLG